MEFKICSRCGKNQTIDCFPIRKTGKPKAYCFQCQRDYDREYHHNRSFNKKKRKNRLQQDRINVVRNYVFEFLKAHGCVDCGETNPIILEFDHVKGIKVSDISTMIRHGCKLDKIKVEIEKCEVRCCNCHRLKTAKDFNWFNTRV